MGKKKEVTVNGQPFTLQSVSPTWYFDHNDACGMTGGKRHTAEYIDGLFKNVVTEPREVAVSGMAYFDEQGDIKTPEELFTAIEKFLRE